jgi:hypothetical protein
LLMAYRLDSGYAFVRPESEQNCSLLGSIYDYRIELRYTDPLIWRQVEVPTSITLKVLHDIIQAVMGWFDYHLWEFRIGKQRYGLPMDDDWGTEPRIAAGKVRLRDVLKPRKTVIDYTYDFGDRWEHLLIVSDVRAGQHGVSYPHFIGGKGMDRPRIAAASQASTNCSKRSPTVLKTPSPSVDGGALRSRLADRVFFPLR